MDSFVLYRLAWLAMVSAAATATFTLVTDTQGAPKFVTTGNPSPTRGSFWLHLFSDSERIDQLSLASISVNATVKPCSVGLKNVTFNATAWHFVQWLLRNNEFLCVLGSNGANATSARVTLPTNGTLSSTNYTIAPGAGNSDFCVSNFTTGGVSLLDCVRVRKSSKASSSLANLTCDCPAGPNGSVSAGHAEDTKSSSLLAADSRGRWLTSSAWPTNFPTPRPFLRSQANQTTLTSTATTSTTSSTTSKSTSAATTTTVFTAGAADRTIDALSTSVATTAVSSISCHDGENNCKNGGSCVRNSSSWNEYYCNCTKGYYGSMCEYEDASSVGSPSLTARTESSCPDSYCQNGGSCRPSPVDAGNVTADNFTCFCEQGYVGKRCAYANVCHSEEPCENGGTCSVLVPVDDTGQSTPANASFRCQCIRGFGGDRCQINAVYSTPAPAADTSCSRQQMAMCKSGVACAAWNNSVCNCATNDTGSCDERTGGAESADSGSRANIAAILGGVFGSLAFIGLIIGSVFLYRCIQRSRKLKGKYNPAKEEMTASGGQTLTMATVPTGERLI